MCCAMQYKAGLASACTTHAHRILQDSHKAARVPAHTICGMLTSLRSLSDDLGVFDHGI